MYSESKADAIVLVDGENVPPWSLGPIDEHLRKEKDLRPFIRRIYGDWGREQMKPWGYTARSFGYEQVQQIRYAQGKDVVDMRMALDALDLCRDLREQPRARRVTFVLISSDSDFIPLVHRLQQDGHEVFVYGEEKSMVTLRNAADAFHDLRKFADEDDDRTNEDRAVNATTELIDFLVDAFRTADHAGRGTVLLSYYGKVLKELSPEFDAKKHGAQKLLDLVRLHGDHFVVEPVAGKEPPEYEISLRNGRRRLR